MEEDVLRQKEVVSVTFDTTSYLTGRTCAREAEFHYWNSRVPPVELAFTINGKSICH